MENHLVFKYTQIPFFEAANPSEKSFCILYNFTWRAVTASPKDPKEL